MRFLFLRVFAPSWLFRGVELIHQMDTPSDVVTIRKILAEVSAPALFAAECGGGDETRDRHEIAMAPVVRRRRRLCAQCAGECFERDGQAVARAEESDVAPHQL